MNRLSKQIGLVLISSSLLLLGCSEAEDPELAEDPNSPNPNSGAANNTWNSNASPGSAYHGGYYGSPGGYRPGLSMTPTGGPGLRSGGGSFSSHVGGSIRGGFGASGHGGGS